jgi:hypothetical protein
MTDNTSANTATSNDTDANAGLTRHNAFPVRLLAWFNERFPAPNALLFFLMYFSAAAVVRQASPQLNLVGDALACLATWSFFLLLRIFDEHKDYALDLRNHPQRVLQSGLITLANLRILGAACLGVQLGWSLFQDYSVSGEFFDFTTVGPATTAWLLMLGWTCLMGKEFFCGEWLEKHLTLYAFSHMLVMPLHVWWLVQIAAPGTPLNDNVMLLMLLGFVGGFCFEITRKTNGAEEERDTIESYSRIFGPSLAGAIVLALTTTMATLQFLLINRLSASFPLVSALILGTCWLLCAAMLVRYIRTPTAKARKLNEGFVALLMLVGYGCLIAEIFSA